MKLFILPFNKNMWSVMKNYSSCTKTFLPKLEYVNGVKSQEFWDTCVPIVHVSVVGKMVLKQMDRW